MANRAPSEVLPLVFQRGDNTAAIGANSAFRTREVVVMAKACSTCSNQGFSHLCKKGQQNNKCPAQGARGKNDEFFTRSQ